MEALGDDYGLPSMNRINDVLSTKTGLLRLCFDGNYQCPKRSEGMLGKKRGK
ncbi:hypothetical protein [Companilactobacillus halodurans]|uniref:hypothetical protein n=1 Tax=Companilactobacillus halodurans TaxID=2584183 RepID=UPI0012952DCE|nr:hypothetical protein [Companilactobacillus halodurans]